MNARLAVHLPPHQLPELQRAARALLRSPLLTARDKERLPVRAQMGDRTAQRVRPEARLPARCQQVSGPPPPPACLDSPSTRGAASQRNGHSADGAYVYLCLTLAALEQPGPSGARVRTSDTHHTACRAATSDSQLDSTEYVQRRAFRDAVRYLEQVGVLAVRDGDVDLLAPGRAKCSGTSTATQQPCAWWRRRRCCGRCRRSRTSSLSPLPSGIEARRRRARHLLNRRMLDQPVVVAQSDLGGDELELAWRNRRREAENISRLTGCEIELRPGGHRAHRASDPPDGPVTVPRQRQRVSHAALFCGSPSCCTEQSRSRPID
jgi:hypothetical protein